jgi:hypothetical protein
MEAAMLAVRLACLILDPPARPALPAGSFKPDTASALFDRQAPAPVLPLATGMPLYFAVC